MDRAPMPVSRKELEKLEKEKKEREIREFREERISRILARGHFRREDIDKLLTIEGWEECLLVTVDTIERIIEDAKKI